MGNAQPKAKRAISLPLMLTILVLLAGLGVSMLTLVGAQRQLSRSDADRRACLLLRSSLESLVREQIRAATIQENHIWASQPGLLSTFDQEGQRSTLYKLYSSAQMQAAGGAEAMAEWESRDAPANWQQYPAMYVNLNASEEGNYPILDPASQGRVEGFSFDNQRGVAMPVTWLYLLRDGQIVAPQLIDGQNGQVSVPGATPDNPITGRIAFWTDDETCRLNVNTAAGGAFWEVPFTTSAADRRFGTHAPVKHEWQRHPGHPARIELASAFPELLKTQVPLRDAILDLAPGYTRGGSNEGVIKTFGRLRLPSLDPGFVMAHRREADWALALAQSSASTMDPGLVAQRSFFITTDSRASNLNLWGRPRVLLWPLDADPSQRLRQEHEFDLLSRLPTTVPSSFSFHRSNPLAPDEATDLSQNPLTLSYLRQMTELDPPGFSGGSLLGKFGARDRDYVLAGVFDYVRTIQSTQDQDPATGLPPSFTTTTGAGVGQILPSGWTVGSDRVQGIGRVPTISEAALHFYGTEVDQNGDTIKVTAVLLLELEFPGQGYPALQPDIAITLHTDPTLVPQVAGTPLAFTGAGSAIPSRTSHLPVNRDEPTWPSGEKLEGGTLSWVATMHGKVQADPDVRKVYPFIFEGLDVSATGTGFPTNFTFNGGEFTVRLSAPLSDGTLRAYQDLVLEFPTPSPIPRWFIPAMDAGLDADGNQVISFDERYATATRSDPDFFGSDLVRSIEVQRDLRNLMRARVADASFFAPGHRDYHTPTYPHVSSLLREHGAFYTPALPGGLVPEASYSAGTIPNLPDNYGQAPGDWENGVGNLPDGAWSRKSDEGFSGGRRDQPYIDPTGGVISNSHPLMFTARQVASPVVLGALNRGRAKDWETLAFCPNPAAGSAHPGLAHPPDYLWLDLFTVPVRQPFPMSDVSSTQGRVNLNQRLVPFPHITRTTALRAALRATALTAIPTEASSRYKSGTTEDDFRHEIDLDATINRWQGRWDRGELFRSETEICGEYLVPQAQGGGNPASWWAGYPLTGDNARESPFGHLLPLLTTRSHAYRTFYQVEKLKPLPGAPADVWTEGEGQVKARLAGSLRFLRCLDPHDLRLKGLDLSQHSLEPYFQIRVEELAEN